MDLRSLEYFLAVAREQNITRAAESLHLTQPTLSRQIKNLEDEFGKVLFVRGKRSVRLTDDGQALLHKARDIVRLARRAEAEMKQSNAVAGDIYIGSGESVSVRHILRMAHAVQQEYPGIHFHFTSGDRIDLATRLDGGLFDFCILYGEIDQSRYAYMPLPFEERWGALMLRDAPLAHKEPLETRDLWDVPLILSRQTMESTNFFTWLGRPREELTITNTSNLFYSSMLMAEEGMGYVITLEHLVNTMGTNLVFRPLEPYHSLRLVLVWKKEQTKKAARIFLQALQREIEAQSE